MKRLVSFVLLTVMSIVLIASCMSGSLVNNAQTESSTIPSNFIDHLPFIINTTDVYYITKDLTVDGDGIKILANNTILIGQGHTITGKGTGTAINISASSVAVVDCSINNFTNGINIVQTKTDNLIRNNRILNNNRGMLLNGIPGNPTPSYDNTIRNNIIINNSVGIKNIRADRTRIHNNYFSNINSAYDASIYTSYWNWTETGSNVIRGSNEGGNYWHDYAGEDTDGDGLGNTHLPYTSNGNIWNGGDYLPLVDVIPPRFELQAFPNSGPSVALNITWKDNVQLSKAILNLDGMNYTDLVKTNESLGFNEYYQVEHRAIYSKSFSNLSLGAHHYRWFANDTRNQWNSTQLLSFNVTAIPQIQSVTISPILEVKANITCEGAGSITEAMDYVKLHFKIDSEWYLMNMSYNPTTKLYSALTPAYNQLANKTIQYYVEALNKNGNKLTSETYSYKTYDWIISDLNRDGKVDLKDVFRTHKDYGKAPPP